MLVDKLHLFGRYAVLFTEQHHVLEEVFRAEDLGLLIVHLVFEVGVERGRAYFSHDAAHPSFKIARFYLVMGDLRNSDQHLAISCLELV